MKMKVTNLKQKEVVFFCKLVINLWNLSQNKIKKWVLSNKAIMIRNASVSEVMLHE